MLVRAKSYRTTMRALASRGFRVISLEMPGCGRASVLHEPWSFEKYAEWLEQVLEVIPLRQPILIGHSNSGPIAILAASEFGQKLGKLVLADTIGADESHSLSRILLARALDALLEAPLTIRAFHHAAYNLLFHTKNLLNQIRLAATTDVTGIVRYIGLPTLLAWGRHDHTMPVRCLDVLRNALPSATVRVSTTGSHDWIVDEPQRFADAVTEFARETS
jgi:pimeloyl-ACP methyl ester carboxylesterase